jgi:hypothetical protein
MSNEIVMDGDGDDDGTIKRPYICKLCSDGVHKRREIFFFLLGVFLLLFSSSSCSRAVIMAIHYMTTSSKTHRNAQPRC